MTVTDPGPGTYTAATTDFTIIAEAPPVLTLPPSGTYEATSSAGVTLTYEIKAVDAEDGVRPVSCSPSFARTSPATFRIGTTTVTCRAEDSEEYETEGTFTITVRDTTGPVLTLPASGTYEALSSAGVTLTYPTPITAVDAVDGTRTVTCTPSFARTSPATFPLGINVVTCSATDTRGNTSSRSFTITVADTTKPTLNLPADTTLGATSAAGAKVTYTATATDTVDSNVPVSCSPASGSTFAVGATTVNCSATDDAGNTRTGSFKVTIVDDVAPVVTAPDDATLEATSAEGAVGTWEASAFDVVDGVLPVTCTPASGSTFALGPPTTVTCTAKDAAGNVGSDSFKITVVDTTGPVFAPHADVTMEAAGSGGALVTFTKPVATDAVDGTVGVTCTPGSGSTFPLGTTKVTCTATDSRGNTSTKTFNVVIADTTAPMLSVPENITKEAISAAGAVVNFAADVSASDVVDGPIGAVCTPGSGSTFPLGATTVTCTAEDSVGNEVSKSFTVTVEDTTEPDVAEVQDIVAEGTGPDGAVVVFATPGATDAVSSDLAVTCLPASETTFELGTTTVTCSATDGAGNTGTSSFTVTVRDTIKPTLTLPAGITKEATSGDGALVTFAPSASDVVSGSVTVACVPGSGSTFALGPTTVECSATDGAGNTASGSFTVTVVDTTQPALDLPSDQTVEATSPAGVPFSFQAFAEDLVDGMVAINCTPGSGTDFGFGPTTVNCSATDAAGNPASGSFTVTVVDTIQPTITFLRQEPAATSYGWNNDDVTLFWGCTDGGSGVVAATDSETVTGEGFALAKSGECQDLAGNRASATGFANIDRTDPVVVDIRLDPTANLAGWNNEASVDLLWNCEDTNEDPDIQPSGVVAASDTKTVTGEGKHSVLVTCTDKAGNIAAPMVDVWIDSEAPSIMASADRAPNAAGWYNADVTVSFACADEPQPLASGVASCPAPVTVDQNTSVAGRVVSGTAYDVADNSASADLTIKLDETAPTVGDITRDVQPNSAGWHNTAVTVSWTCTDALSGIIDGQLTSATFSTEARWFFTPQCRDVAGNTGLGPQQLIFIDLTAPGIAFKSRTAANDDGWNTGPVTVAWDCSDALSGPASPTVSTTVSTEGADQSAAGTCTDIAGNTRSDTQRGINIDTTAPGIAFESRTAANDDGWNTDAVTVTWTCTDGLSGPVSATVTETASDEGAGQSLTGTCADIAGNTRPDTQGDINIDLTNPTVDNVARSVAANSDGYNNTDVTVSWTCADELSGVSIAQASQSRTVSAAGDTTVTPTCTDIAGRTAAGNDVLVKIDKTAPTVTFDGVSPAPNSASWNNTQPVTLTWTCADDRSGVVAATRTRTVELDGTFDDLTATCADNAGNQTTSDPETVRLDTVPPTVNGSADRAANGNGWYNADVTVSFTCGDDVPSSGVAVCPDAVVVGDNTAVGGQAVVGTASDTAGNSATSAPVNVKLDETAPTITYAGRTAANGDGWNNGSVTVTWDCADALSGVDATSVSATVSDEGANLPATGTCTDAAGNTSGNTQGGINIDLTKPAAPTFNAVVAGAAYVFGSVPAGVTCSSSDALSGLTAAGCVVTGYGTTVGSHTLTATATDKAGNVETSQLTYTVSAWTLKGFYQPVDMGGTINTVKAGSTVPLKFEVFAGTTEQTATTAVTSFSAVKVNCQGLAAAEDAIEEFATTGGTSLRYDATGGQFIQNWQTPRSGVGACYRATMTTQDGSTLVAYFKLK